MLIIKLLGSDTTSGQFFDKLFDNPWSTNKGEVSVPARCGSAAPFRRTSPHQFVSDLPGKSDQSS